MSDWRPTCSADVATRRARMLQDVREYFAAESVLEVDTPALSASAVSDVHIESLAVVSTLSEQALYLHTSPEFCMKRLLAAGYPDIYSICRVFRDGESGRHHQPEFTILEWYRRDFDLAAIIEDTLHVIAVALDQVALNESATVLDYRDAFISAVEVDPLTATTTELADASSADPSLRAKLGDSRDDWLDYLLSSTVTKSFATDRLTVLRHYPASQAALARLCPSDPNVADRFEVFRGSVELANGYVELDNAEEQRRRIASDQAERLLRGRQQRPTDEMLVAALDVGLPKCAGVAIGVERLHMVREHTNDIRDVICFAFEQRP